MNLSDGDDDALALALLSESEETTPCMVYQKKKNVQKERKEDASYCLLKEERCA
jgi:hypothetical protein